MNEPTIKELFVSLAEFRAEFAAFRDQLAAGTPADKRIEPDALYSVEEATTKIAISGATLRKKLRARIIVAKGGSKGCPWKIRGSELLKLGGKAA